MFAWTVPPLGTKVPWIVSMISLITIGYSTVDFDTILCGYLIDVSLEFFLPASGAAF